MLPFIPIVSYSSLAAKQQTHAVKLEFMSERGVGLSPSVTVCEEPEAMNETGHLTSDFSALTALTVTALEREFC